MKDKYLKENLEVIVRESINLTDALRKMGLRAAGGNFKVLNKYIKLYNIDTSHHDENRRAQYNDLHNKKLLPLNTLLVENCNYNRVNLKRRLYQSGLKERVCELCGQNELWNGNKLSLILDHINGVHNDNRIENLRIVCPNCNATLDTHCGKNRGRRFTKCKSLGIENTNIDLRTIKRVRTDYQKEKDKIRRKVERPSIEILLKEVKELGYSAVGRKYGVSDNAIRKWIK